MTLTLADFLQIDFPALLAGNLAALTCGLLGNFLILRRQALIGDAFSHAVLPGLVIGFLVAGTVAALPMIIGALAAVVVATLLIEIVRQFARVEPGAAMGVIFTSLFALGVVLLEAGLGNVHLDAQHALYGQLEFLFWIGPNEWTDLLSPAHWVEIPRGLAVLLIAFPITALTIILFFKELMAMTFDAAGARQAGIPVGLLNTALMGLVAFAAVAAFDAVGSILVIAMFICPPATARLLTDRLSRQLWISGIIAVVTASLGYMASAWLPLWLGLPFSVNAAGGMVLTSGLALALAIILAPRYGVMAQGRQARRSVKAAP